ncbi:aspartate aminotransferase family protein, partial [filamentous cyanobacterium CCP5]
MNVSNLPPTAFVDPFGRNRAAIAPLLQQVSQQILDYLSGAATTSPLPEVSQAPQVRIPIAPVAVTDLLAQIQHLMAQSMNPAHPGYMGHMDPMPSTFSMLGDWVAAALNNNLLSVEMSPVLSRLETLLMGEIARMFGLGDKSGGVLVSGGSLANLQALIVARNAKLGVLESGLMPFGKAPVVLTSELAHSSVQKAAMVAGLGTEGAIAIPTSEKGQMDGAVLRSHLQQVRENGQYPFMVLATAGTTVTGNIDPLGEIGDIARENDLWFHVDGAYGGALVFSDQHRHRLAGIEQADSVTFNPQKWLYVTKTCASVMFRDMAVLEDHFRVAAPHMHTAPDWPNLG